MRTVMDHFSKHWPPLHKLWESTQKPLHSESHNAELWQHQQFALFSLGISQEETLRYLYHERPDLDTFRNWLLDRSKRDADYSSEPQHEDVLTPEDIDFWNRRGYVVVKNAITPGQCAETRNAIWNFLKARPDDPDSWYRTHEEQRGLMLLFADHPALHANRESARIRRAYEQLYNTKDIFKVVDKVSFNPPETNGFHFAGSALHWDASLTLPVPDEFQGLLYLTDCDAHEGAFHCVAGFHREIGAWLDSLPPGADPRALAPEVLKPVAVPGKAGDFVIWHQALPHCATPNRGTTPRMVQYLTWLPLKREKSSVWK